MSRLGMFRDSEKQLKSSLRDQEMVDTYLYLSKVYVRLDQPLTAIEVFNKASIAIFSLCFYFKNWRFINILRINYQPYILLSHMFF